MIRVGIVFFFTLITAFAFAQRIHSVWEGQFHTDMDHRGIRRSFFMHLELVQEGSRISGRFYTAPPDWPGEPGVIYAVTGKISRKKFPMRLTRSGILYHMIPRGIAEVFSDFELNLAHTDSGAVLYGKWFPSLSMSPRPDGAGGFVKLRRLRFPAMERMVDFLLKEDKPRPPKRKAAPVPMPVQVKSYRERKDTLLYSLVTDSSQINLSLYDNGELDGDTVSVYINNQPVVLRAGLKLQPLSYPLVLEKGKTYRITLFAENLGSIPPNTAFLSIQCGKQICGRIFLSADTEQNASVEIRLRE